MTWQVTTRQCCTTCPSQTAAHHRDLLQTRTSIYQSTTNKKHTGTGSELTAVTAAKHQNHVIEMWSIIWLNILKIKRFQFSALVTVAFAQDLHT